MARCSEAARDLQDLMLCCEERGWAYELGSQQELDQDDEVVWPKGHRATVTTTRGYSGSALGTNATDALRGALAAVETMDERQAKGQDVAAMRSKPGEYFWQAVAVDPPKAPHVPKSAEDMVNDAYTQYCADRGQWATTPDWWAFRSAFVLAAAGRCFPGTGTVWAKHEMPGPFQCAVEQANQQAPRPEPCEDCTRSMADRVRCAYWMHRPTPSEVESGQPYDDYQRFKDALQQHLGGCFIPPRGHEWKGDTERRREQEAARAQQGRD